MSTTVQIRILVGTYAVDRVHSQVGFAIKHIAVRAAS